MEEFVIRSIRFVNPTLQYSITPLLHYFSIPSFHFFKHGMTSNHYSLSISCDNSCTNSSSFLPTAWKAVFGFGQCPHDMSGRLSFPRPHGADGRKKRDQALHRYVSMGSVRSFFHTVWFFLLLGYWWWVLYGIPDRWQCQAIRKRSGSWNNGGRRRTLIPAPHASYGWRGWVARFLSPRPNWCKKREKGSQWLIQEEKISYDKILSQIRVISKSPRFVRKKIY